METQTVHESDNMRIALVTDSTLDELHGFVKETDEPTPRRRSIMVCAIGAGMVLAHQLVAAQQRHAVQADITIVEVPEDAIPEQRGRSLNEIIQEDRAIKITAAPRYSFDEVDYSYLLHERVEKYPKFSHYGSSHTYNKKAIHRNGWKR
jgi:hypothetical protein